MELKSSPKIFENYKCEYPEKTIEKICNGFEKIGLNFNYMEFAVNTETKSAYYSTLLQENLGFATHGKGTTQILTKASAYAEMAERFSSCFFSFKTLENEEKYGPLIKSTINREFLRGYEKNENIDMYNFDIVNKKYFIKPITESGYKILLEQKLFDTLVDSYSLIDNKYHKIPIKFYETLSGSTGLAAGNTLEEAISQACCEIFERYSASHFVTKKSICPTIDISTIENEEIHRYIEMFKEMNMDVIVKDFTLGNKVPTIGMLLINNNLGEETNIFKKQRRHMRVHSGAHVDLKQALLRCFTEIFQGYTKDEFMYGEDLDKVYNFWSNTLNKEFIPAEDDFRDFFKMYDYHDDLEFLLKGDVIPFDSLNSHENDDALDDVKDVLKICQNNNWEFQVVDYTNPMIGLPVVRVVMAPISTDSDPFLLRFLSMSEYKDRYNVFYGIDDFYKYVNTDDWINNTEEIKNLVQNLLKTLTGDLTTYSFYISRGAFNKYVNLFHILAFSYLSLENYEEALKYLKFLYELNDNPIWFDKYYNCLCNQAYAPPDYQAYITLVEKELQHPGTMKKFVFDKNPLELDTTETKEIIKNLLILINNSFFSKN